jgi:tRNA-splicing ligase RtcB
MTIKKVINKGKPVKVWTDEIDDNAIEQLENISQMPFIHKHVAAMPDVHWGMGATIGSVIPTKGAVIPAAVGVDLGCGMMAVQTSLTANDLPDNLHQIRCDIEAAIPHGRTDNSRSNDKGSWRGDTLPSDVCDRWLNLEGRYNKIIEKHPKAKGYNSLRHMGTLGTGNHFIEVCLDESDHVWVMLHSGSRGAGNKIGSYFIEQAKKEMERYHITPYLPDKDLSYLVEHTELFDDYVEAVEWAQDFASENRKAMMENVLDVLHKHFGQFSLEKEAINCHHNYIARENHFNANVIITRKGAIRAREGDLGIIPGSMGAKSFIVRGKGNKESLCSCSHGAGRKLGRKQAQKLYTAEDLAAQTEGIECPKDEARVDEIPAAYKSIDAVMENQSDLVEVLHTLRQVINVKG